MTERLTNNTINTGEERCINCIFGKEYIALIFRGSISDEGVETHQKSKKVIPVGQTRNCLSYFQRSFQHLPSFIYPKEDDTCINPKKYKHK